jgi:hypothetical protein
VVDHQVDAVMFVLIIHVDSTPHDNMVSQARGPFIPASKTGAFWPVSVSL